MSTQDPNMDPLAIAIKAVEIYATMHPRPAHVSQKQAAEMLNRSVPTVRDLVRSGQLKMNSCGLIPITEIDRVLRPVPAV